MKPEFRFAQNQEEAGAVLGVSGRTFREWIAQGCDCWVEGCGYSIRKALAWAVANRWTPKQPANPEALDRREAAELRKAEAVAELTEARAESIIGALIDRETVEAEIDRMAGRLLERLAAVPGELAAVVPEAWRAGIALDSADRISMIRREVESFVASRPWATRPAAEVEQTERGPNEVAGE